MSDIGHSRVLSKSQLFSFSAPTGCVFTVGCHVLLSFDIYLVVYGDLPCWKEVWGRLGEMQMYKFSFLKRNVKGCPVAVHVQSKKHEYFKLFYKYCLFIRFDLPINEPVFRNVG